MEDRTLPCDASLEDYYAQAQELLDAFNAGHGEARSCFKWEHPRFRDRPLSDTERATLDLPDAELVLARVYGFEDWKALEEFAEAITQDGSVNRFERAVEAVVAGDVDQLRELLRTDSDLVRAPIPMPWQICTAKSAPR